MTEERLRAVVGVDPGARETGLVVRVDYVLRAHTVARRGRLELNQYGRTIVSWIAQNSREPRLVAIEDVHAPNPRLGVISVTAILETAKLIGYLMRAFPDCLLVPPGGHGKAPFRVYPSALVSEREIAGRPAGRGGWAQNIPVPEFKGSGILRHCRSAWDIAGAAPMLARIREATG